MGWNKGKFKLLLALYQTISVKLDSLSCPNGMKSIGDTCYELSLNETDYNKALENCRSEAGELLWLETEGEATALYKLLVTAFQERQIKNWFIGT